MPTEQKDLWGRESDPSRESLVKKVEKRNGVIAPFDFAKIVRAVDKAMRAAQEGSLAEASKVAEAVLGELASITAKYKNFIPSVEGIQDTVEKELILGRYVKTAKAYILYRDSRAKLREAGAEPPEHVKKLAEESKKYFKNPLGEFVYYRTYARWIETESRRETWIETVDRYMSFMRGHIGAKLADEEYALVREAILRQEIMPSMRLLQFAGPAAEKTNVCAYNCSFIAPESFQDLAEIMYISMCGTGVGWSVESQNVQRFPQIKNQTGKKLLTYIISDSKEGWADALSIGTRAWVTGEDIDFDFGQLRPAGARLRTMGGKASGPEPLKRLLAFTREKMLARQGKRLRNIDVHDIICMIGDCVVSGGVRRSAMISLSDLDDIEIRDAKKGSFYINEPQRMLANDSAVYMTRPSSVEFMDEWVALMKSGSGERGIFNRGSLARTLPARRIKALKKYEGYFDASGNVIGPIGTNPCGEIILQSKQFCNLSEVVARKDDTEEDLIRKIRLATILGTYQATLTHFPYLSEGWKKHCEHERLLGVSVTGQWDSPVVRRPAVLRAMRRESIRANKEYSKRFGINPATAITAVKPSGTVSQTVDCASGMHPRHSEYYIRRVRISATDSLFKMLKDQGVPYFPEVGQSPESATTYVLEFPVKAPEGSIYKDDISAIGLLEYWKTVKLNYTEHNPSVTISVGEDEWIEVGNWVYENWDIVGGLSFLPRDNHVYQLAPYEAITKEKYEELASKLEHIDYSKIISYERTDELDVKKELACVAGVCEIA
ncbi:MAG: ribonucleoside-triphosphate reductase [Patescibacteria group bacterium]|nr:ribonucleoside-triphosphate reductase [Patescibacteria group bacterium]MDE2116665.1 ribonucleoside-triphosphate reductase [Patescibacteria group bacterium]